ncbi:class II fumarate hydratase [Oceanithermus desulfurans]|uniref:Fumarate hydratase class II n=2 Tax=Oceanithermus desulfurans TaxID=227924 RepID=A0A511RKN2_9DEIN|nr:class II fumarate hydratase [Oceanithermus desulfurans]MBB6029539.1 fumarate hydratase class II [Oceanithermus desulfurans]GEM90175.1 fumarate hydratase class II [Oceanithermus desulfurans NBRC 100063]
MEYRIEKDSMGELKVPADAYYGAQTARAVENFPISGLRFPRTFIQAMGAIKHAAASVNLELGLLDEERARAILQAAEEVIEGKLDDQFVVDIFQTGSGTSTNMNTNEVIAGRANEILTGRRGGKDPVHPNDHVNYGQSSNDTIPTAIHVALAVEVNEKLLPALRHLHAALVDKAELWDDVVKIGRTHLMDATPIRMGQEASGWARQVELAIERIESTLPRIYELAQGGTAVGTGINTHPEFGRRVAEKLAARFGLPFREAANHFEAQHSKDAAVELAGQLATVATSLIKVANDIRWLSSGPRCGIAEIKLPAVQPGSSIMPGKVNPVMAEALMMVCTQVIGNATTVQVANTHGNLDLNVMMPVIARNLLESITFLANAVRVFTDKAVAGMEADREKAASYVEWSLAMVTSLAPVIGYDRAAQIAKKAVAEGKTVREVCLEEQVLPEDELNAILDPWKMTEPGIPGR